MLTLHHLDYSRSTRVLWLLEELNVSYQLVRYPRAVGAIAPASLNLIHPLGKSPVIVDDGLTLAESSAILRYLDARYGSARFTPANVLARARHDEWLDYVEGSLALLLFVPLMVGSALPEPLREGFATQLNAAWTHVETTVAHQPYLMGDDLTLADVQMSYILAVASTKSALDARPALGCYLKRLLARPALQRALVAGGPMA